MDFAEHNYNNICMSVCIYMRVRKFDVQSIDPL